MMMQEPALTLITSRMNQHDEQLRDHNMIITKLNDNTRKLNESIEETYELLCEAFDQISNLRKQQVAAGIERRLQRRLLIRRKRIKTRIIKYLPHALIGLPLAYLGIKTLDVTKMLDALAALHF